MNVEEVANKLRLSDNIKYNFGPVVEAGEVTDLSYYFLDSGEETVDVWVKCSDGTYTCIGAEDIISIKRRREI